MSSSITNTTFPGAKAGRFKKSVSLPPETVEYLKSWMMSPEHVAHPYPTEQEKAQIMAETGIELKQLTNWFVNNRKRFWKPRVEAKLQKYPLPINTMSGTHVPASAPGGGLSISINQMNPKPQGAASFPMLPNNAAASASLYATAQGSSPHGHPGNSGPAEAAIAAIAAVSGAHQKDDPHTISEGSASSACNSDDDSAAAPSNYNGSNVGAAFAQCLDSRLAAVRTSTASTTGPSSLPTGGYRRHEEVDVHVLRPEGATGNESTDLLPSLRDLTIKSFVPKERILATFKCPISYTIPYAIEQDPKKVQSRRDGEVLRVKKHYLKLYLATRGIHSASSPVGNVDVPSSASSVSSTTESSVATSIAPTATSLNITFSAIATTSSFRTRSFSCTATDQDRNNSNPPPPKRHCSHPEPLVKGEDEWRSLCQNADSFFCDSLPGLEDAVRMFGYVSQ